MSKFQYMTKSEIDTHITRLEAEVTTCGIDRMKEIDKEIRSANEAVLSGKYRKSLDDDDEEEFVFEKLNGRNAQMRSGSTFNPISTYVQGQGSQMRSLGSFAYGVGNTNNGSDKNMFANESEELRASREYREAFYKVIMGKNATPEERALVTTATGSAVVPTSTFNQVVENVQKAVGLLNKVRILDIPGKLTVPQADIQTPATWHVEGEEISDSNAPPKSTTLTGFELAKLFSMSAATQAMSINSFENYLVQELSRCTRDALADVIINGTGSGQPLGILNGLTWDATNSKVMVNDYWTALIEAMALLPANFRQNACFTMNSTMFYSYVSVLLDANGAPIFGKDITSGLPTTLLGKPLVIDDLMPDNTIIFGDPMFYFLNFSQPMAIERSGEAGFTKATIIYRSLAVVDGRPVAPAFVKITRQQQ